MDRFKKMGPIEGQLGRMIRNMSLQSMVPNLQTGSWFPAADVYETSTDIIVYVDVAGVSPDRISVVVDESSLTVSGERNYPSPDKVACIHQLEIERTFFERTILLPKPIDVGQTASEYHNGFLIVTMPLQQNRGKIKIEVR